MGLVTIFMKRGLYVRASEIVCSVLLRNRMKRDIAAPSRLPEKGSIDFVPYSLINSLWNIITAEISSPTCQNNRRMMLVKARIEVEKALETHFELMKLSEIGKKSARILQS